MRHLHNSNPSAANRRIIYGFSVWMTTLYPSPRSSMKSSPSLLRVLFCLPIAMRLVVCWSARAVANELHSSDHLANSEETDDFSSNNTGG